MLFGESYLRIKEAMITNPVTIRSNASISEAAKLMADKNIGSLLIFDRDKLLGIVTEKDLVRRVLALGKDPQNFKVGDVMSKPVITTFQDADVLDASELMKKHSIRRLAVMDDGKLVGIITTDDIVRSMKRAVEELATTLYIISKRK